MGVGEAFKPRCPAFEMPARLESLAYGVAYGLAKHD
jgi:hypothetical protein